MTDITDRIAAKHYAASERTEVYGHTLICACRDRFIGQPNEARGWSSDNVARRMHAIHVAEVTERTVRQQIAQGERP